MHGPGTDEPIVWYEGSGTTAKNWFYADHLGSIVATANATGASTGIYSYGPYGEPNTTTGPRFRYTGQQLIGELGLYHYKARFYSPSLGRFLQTDPIGYKDDVNLYAYVGNNPGNRIDPTGLASLGAWASSARASSSLSTLAGDISWIDGGTAPAGSGDASYQVTWITPMDMLDAKRHSLLEGGGGGRGGDGGGWSGGAQNAANAVGRSGALNAAKRDLGIPRSQHPDSVNPVPMTDRSGNATLGVDGRPIMTREYTYTRSDGGKVVVQDHSAGHRFGEGGRGDQGSHFNVRPSENTRNGSVPGSQDHYPW